MAIFPYGDRGAHICIRANFYRHKAQQSSTEQEAYAIGVDAYLYFYSLITMDITRKELSNVDPGKGLGGSMNSFANILAYPSADIKVVVRPISTRSTPLDGPVIVSVPDTGDMRGTNGIRHCFKPNRRKPI